MSKEVQHVHVCDWCGAKEDEKQRVLKHGDSCTINPNELPPFWVRVHYAYPANLDGCNDRDACAACAERLELYSARTLELLATRRQRRAQDAESDRELDKMT